MKAERFTFFVRVSAFRPSKALVLIMLALLLAATAGNAQTTVFVPGNASGCFGNRVDVCVPLVAAIKVSGPGTITVTYVSGMLIDGDGNFDCGPSGVTWSITGSQLPLEEANGVSGGTVNNLDALIGVFVPQYRVNDRRGFHAIDGTKNLTRVGIEPHLLRFIGESRTFNVHEAGTLFLGVNDNWVEDNSGGFTVTVTATTP